MYKLIGCFFIFYLWSNLLTAQNDSSIISINRREKAKRNIIKVFYYGPYAGGYHLAFERMLRKRISAQLAVRYIHYSNKEASYNSRNDLYLKPEIRFYLSKERGLKGFYLGAVTYFEFLKVIYRYSPPHNSFNKEILNGFYLGEELHIGYQWLIKKVISLDVNAGARYMKRIGPVQVVDYRDDGMVSKTQNYFDTDHGYFTPENLLPSFLFTVGVAF